MAQKRRTLKNAENTVMKSSELTMRMQWHNIHWFGDSGHGIGASTIDLQ